MWQLSPDTISSHRYKCEEVVVAKSISRRCLVTFADILIAESKLSQFWRMKTNRQNRKWLAESEMTGSELLDIAGNPKKPFPPRHLQHENLLQSCLWVWGYWINWFLADLYFLFLWCIDFLMMVCCQRHWNHRSLQTLFVYITWAGIMMKGMNAADIPAGWHHSMSTC